MEQRSTMGKLLKIIHRINTIEELKKIPREYGVEVDIRGYGKDLLLSHEPINKAEKYDTLSKYLNNFNHAFIVLNLKEAGYEEKIIKIMKGKRIEKYFLLDCEFPFIYKATRKDNFRKIAARYSEAEPIEFIEAQIKNGKPLLDWVWIDTNTRLPLNKKIVKKLKPFKTCLVCPERWGRPEDISSYRSLIKNFNFNLDAVMTSKEYVGEWEK